MKEHKTIALGVLTIASLLLNGSTPTPHGSGLLERELAELIQRGLTYRIVDNTDCSTCGNGQRVEVYDPRTALTNRFPLEPLLTPREPKYTGLPTLTIDLTTIDTSLYNWKYRFHSSIPVTGVSGYALPSDDVNNNGKTEVYGIFQDIGSNGTKIYELNNSQWVDMYTYPFQVGVAEFVDDIDRDGLKEVFTRDSGILYVFDQTNQNQYPTRPKFQFVLGSAFLIPNELNDMGNDGIKELLYRGGERDSGSMTRQKTYVAKFDSLITNFTPIWSVQLPPDCFDVYCSLNLDTGDFDDDGRKDFVTSSFWGQAYVVENRGPDSFTVA